MGYEAVSAEVAQDLGGTVFDSVKMRVLQDVMSSFVSVGMLGSEDHYNLPRTIIEAVANYLGGYIVKDIPSFFVPCTDGIALVVTIKQCNDYVGGAIFLPEAKLLQLDHGIHAIWQRAVKRYDVLSFFKDTAFKVACPAMSLPSSVEASWHSSFC